MISSSIKNFIEVLLKFTLSNNMIVLLFNLFYIAIDESPKINQKLSESN